MNAGNQVNGAVILALGILSLLLCPLLGPAAWIVGNNALAQLDQGGDNPSERTLVNAGRICGIIATVLMLLILAAIVLFFLIILVVGGMEGGAG